MSGPWEAEIVRAEHNAEKISEEWRSRRAHDEQVETHRLGVWALEREKMVMNDGRVVLEALQDELETSLRGTAKRCDEKQKEVQAAISRLYETFVHSINSMMYGNVATCVVSRAREEEVAATAGHARALKTLETLASDLENKHTTSVQEAEASFRASQRRVEEEWWEEEGDGVTRIVLEQRLGKLVKEAEMAKTIHQERMECVQPGGEAAQRRLLEADGRDEAWIEAREGELLRLEGMIAQWREKTAKHSKAWQSRIDEAYETKSAAVKEYNNMQHCLLNEQRRHEKIMEAISQSADQVEAQLGEIVRLAEQTKRRLETVMGKEVANCITI